MIMSSKLDNVLVGHLVAYVSVAAVAIGVLSKGLRNDSQLGVG